MNDCTNPMDQSQNDESSMGVVRLRSTTALDEILAEEANSQELEGGSARAPEGARMERTTNKDDQEEQSSPASANAKGGGAEQTAGTQQETAEKEETTPSDNSSRMEKDPLNIGVPMPVIVERCGAESNSEKSPRDAMKDADAFVVNSKECQAAVVGDAKDAADMEMGVACDPISSPPAAESHTLGMMMTSLPGGYAVGGPPPGVYGHNDEVTGEFSIEEEESSAPPQGRSFLQRQGSSALLEATLVNEEEGEELRMVIAEAKPLRWSQRSGGSFVLGVLFIIAAAIVAVVLSFALTRDRGGDPMVSDSSGTSNDLLIEGDVGGATAAPRLPTLQAVRERGFLRCGAVQQLRDFFANVHQINVENNYTSFKEILGVPSIKTMFVPNLCSSIAGAVLGNTSAYEVLSPREEEKFHMLANGSIDVLMTRKSITMDEDIYIEELDGTGEGIAYGFPYLYGGLGFTGDPAYVNCADDNIRTHGNCSALTICINQESIFLKDLQLRIPQRQVVVESHWMPLMEAFQAGKCNVIATESAVVISAALRAIGFDGELAVGEKEHNTEMWGMKTLDSDQEWHNFLDAIVMALLAAEQAGVTQKNAHRMGKTSIFGEEFEDMFINALAGGNYGQIYSFPMPRDGRNRINDGSTGLLASPPLGAVDQPNGKNYPIVGGTLKTVLERGVLHCGVRGGRTGFAIYNSELAKWGGMDVEYCRALATALFDGDSQAVIFEDINSIDGYAMLRDGVLDVYAGATWTLQADMNGFSFSQPYFYGPIDDESFDENLCLATNQSDAQWSSFVYWTAQSLVYAEEHGIFQADSNSMPLVYCFGEDLLRMFRDIVHFIGCYAQVYERNLAAILPRSGRNRLNLAEAGITPLRYIPPGFAVLDR